VLGVRCGYGHLSDVFVLAVEQSVEFLNQLYPDAVWVVVVVVGEEDALLLHEVEEVD